MAEAQFSVPRQPGRSDRSVSDLVRDIEEIEAAIARVDVGVSPSRGAARDGEAGPVAVPEINPELIALILREYDAVAALRRTMVAAASGSTS